MIIRPSQSVLNIILVPLSIQAQNVYRATSKISIKFLLLTHRKKRKEIHENNNNKKNKNVKATMTRN